MIPPIASVTGGLPLVVTRRYERYGRGGLGAPSGSYNYASKEQLEELEKAKQKFFDLYERSAVEYCVATTPESRRGAWNKMAKMDGARREFDRALNTHTKGWHRIAVGIGFAALASAIIALTLTGIGLLWLVPVFVLISFTQGVIIDCFQGGFFLKPEFEGEVKEATTKIENLLEPSNTSTTSPTRRETIFLNLRKMYLKYGPYKDTRS